MGAVRSEPSVLHVDLDAFFAAVEQRDKPSLRGKPVVVGGLGPRGVVATASYEAREYGVRSAMSMAQARARCPHAAYLWPRFPAYQAASRTVMGVLRELSPAIEPISLDEAFVDLAAGAAATADAAETAAWVKAGIHAATGLTASVGAGTSKLVAKIASDLGKPDGLVVVAPGAELELLDPMPVTRLWSVGPVTAERLRRIGVHAVAELRRVDEAELMGMLGKAHGSLLARLARADDDRPVSAERESKSVSIEDTFDRDVVERAVLTATLERMAERVCQRLRGSGLAGRTVTVKARQHDFTTISRSATLPGPSDDVRVVAPVARRLLGEIDTSDGIRLLGVGVSGLADWSQEDLFAEQAAGAEEPAVGERPAVDGDAGPAGRSYRWVPGQDVAHGAYGPGWVWGAGLGRVTVRFETRESGPGPVRTLAADDPQLSAGLPQPMGQTPSGASSGTTEPSNSSKSSAASRTRNNPAS
jgi:DNA polymerase-4